MYVENSKVKVEDLGGGVTRKVLAYSENIMSVELYFEKGATGAPHQHAHEQIGYIVSGSLVYMEAGKEKKVLKTGDTYYVPPHVVHGIEALENTVLLDMFTPMRKDFVK